MPTAPQGDLDQLPQNVEMSGEEFKKIYGPGPVFKHLPANLETLGFKYKPGSNFVTESIELCARGLHFTDSESLVAYSLNGPVIAVLQVPDRARVICRRRALGASKACASELELIAWEAPAGYKRLSDAGYLAPAVVTENRLATLSSKPWARPVASSFTGHKIPPSDVTNARRSWR